MTRHAHILSLFAALSWLANVAADVTLSLPLSSQLPPIAHSGQPYSFTISRDTFQFQIPERSRAPPSPPTLLYAAQNVPTWLSFDASTLTFKGNVPANQDIGKRLQVTVTGTLPQSAAGLGGNTTATDAFNLLVLNEPEPTVKIPIVQQLTSASSLGPAYMAAPDAIHLPLGWSFSIGLSGDTFAISTGSNVYWSVSLAGGESLPDWLQFSADTYDFYGVAPVDVDANGADEYDVVVTGSNRPGYGGVSQTFKLIVASHTLSLAQGLAPINASIGEFLSQSVTTDALRLSGGQQAALSNITVTAEIPASSLSWLAFDTANRTFTGTPPYELYGNASSTSKVIVPVSFADSNHNQLTVNQTIRIPPSAFTGFELPNIVIADTAYVNVSIAQFLRNSTTAASTKRSKSTSRRAPLNVRAPTAGSSQNVTVETDPAAASSWLKFDPVSLLLSGQVPSDWSQRVHVLLSSTNSHASFYLMFNGEDADPSGNKNGNGGDSGDGGATLSPHTRIALGASLGVAAALLALIALVCCCFRRRHGQTDNGDRTRDRNYAAQRDEDEGTLTDQTGRRKWKKAIVIGRAGVGEIGTPSTIAVSPMPGHGFDEKDNKDKTTSPQNGTADLHSVVVVSPNGRQRDAMHEAEAPMQSRLIANLFGGGGGGKSNAGEGKKKRASGIAATMSAGLGLSMLGDSVEKLDDPFAGPTTDSRGRIRHQRSRESVRSHRSSWESDLFYEDAPSTQQNHRGIDGTSDESATAVNDGEGEDMPRRRGKPTANALNVRHRTTHNNQSPAFNAPEAFVTQPNAAAAALNNSSRGLDQIGMSAVDSGLSTSDDSHHGIALSSHEGDVRVLKARVMQVQRHSPVLHQGANNPFAHSSARTEHSSSQADATSSYDTHGGAFDDAAEEEDDDEGEWLAKGQNRASRIAAAAAARNKRTSTLSALTDTSHYAGVRAHYANEAARENAVAAGRVPPSDSFLDGISISGIDPHESLKPVIVRAHTPPPVTTNTAAYGATPQTPNTPSKRLSTTGAASGRFLPCPTVNAVMGHLLRFHLYPSVPPPLAGAMGSPGKRSGRTVRYELVMLDDRAHLAKYKAQWPAMLSDWLALNATTFEVEGIVPRAAELEQLGDCEIALVSTTRISGNPNSPDRAEGKRSSVSSISYDSSAGVPPPAMHSNDEERTVVARAKLVFQNAAPRPFFPPRKGQAF